MKTKIEGISEETVENALIAFLHEKSAQMGESFPCEAWVEYKNNDPNSYQEEIVQMQCAIRSLLASGEVVLRGNQPTALGRSGYAPGTLFVTAIEQKEGK